MKNVKNFALVGTMALALAACGNNNTAPANTATEPASTENVETVDTAEAVPTEGTATVPGYGGDIQVTVHFGEDGVIESIDTVHSETDEIGGAAITELTDAIIAANGTDGVDNVSGATVTSEAFKKAVDEAIVNAQ